MKHTIPSGQTASAVTRVLSRAMALWQRTEQLLNGLQPLAGLLARVYVAKVFFLSGLTKLRDWDITLALFSDEYRVPLLSPAVAAAMGTAGELVLPVLLVVGLGTRIAALGLSVVNVIAVISLMEIPPEALQQHIVWGILLIGIVAFGGGRWTLDTVGRRWWEQKE